MRKGTNSTITRQYEQHAMYYYLCMYIAFLLHVYAWLEGGKVHQTGSLPWVTVCAGTQDYTKKECVGKRVQKPGGEAHTCGGD
jgi:hypothetical protein